MGSLEPSGGDSGTHPPTPEEPSPPIRESGQAAAKQLKKGLYLSMLLQFVWLKGCKGFNIQACVLVKCCRHWVGKTEVYGKSFHSEENQTGDAVGYGRFRSTATSLNLLPKSLLFRVLFHEKMFLVSHQSQLVLMPALQSCWPWLRVQPLVGHGGERCHGDGTLQRHRAALDPCPASASLCEPVPECCPGISSGSVPFPCTLSVFSFTYSKGGKFLLIHFWS